MSTVLSFSAAVEKRKEEDKTREMTEKCRNLNALISELSIVVNKHVNSFGTTNWQASGAALYILAQALAKADPKLDRPEIREFIHTLLDKQVDEALIQLWQDQGEVP